MSKRIPKKFAMLSKDGNAAVHQMLVAALSNIKSRDAPCSFVRSGIERISKTHDEVYDTEVRTCILDTVITNTKFNSDELYPRIMFGKDL